MKNAEVNAEVSCEDPLYGTSVLKVLEGRASFSDPIFQGTVY